MGNIGGNMAETFYYYYFLIHFFPLLFFFIFTFIESNLNNTTIKINT